jgi:hypothetical protein
MARRRVELPVVGQHADEHDGAGHGEREAEDDRGGPPPAEQVRTRGAEPRGDGALDDRAGNRHAAHGEQLVEMELEADAEHQQDDADLGELTGQMRIGHEAGVGADQQAGEQVADDR